MGQKAHPTAMRLGIIRTSKSRWFQKKKKDFANNVIGDFQIRRWLKEQLVGAAIGDILIERQSNKVGVVIMSARPGVIIGKRGDDIEKIKSELGKIAQLPVHVSIKEIRKVELYASLVAEGIAQQLEKRVMFRKAMKRAVTLALKSGAKGIKVCVAGRLGGAEIARTEWYREGRVPLHTLRADIDYGVAEASTTYGIIGVKVWIFKGEILGKDENAAESAGEKKQ